MRFVVTVLAAAVVVATAWGGRAAADDWVVDAAASRVAFTYTFGGTEREGSFARFEGRGSFDADSPEAARLTLRIETESIELGNALEEALATSVEGFDSRNHPLASFELQRLDPLGADRFRVRGVAEMKGRRRPLTGDGTLRIADGVARAEGEVRLDRLQFRVGVGPFASLVDIGRWVTVEYSLVARLAGGGSERSQ